MSQSRTWYKTVELFMATRDADKSNKAQKKVDPTVEARRQGIFPVSWRATFITYGRAFPDRFLHASLGSPKVRSCHKARMCSVRSLPAAPFLDLVMTCAACYVSILL